MQIIAGKYKGRKLLSPPTPGQTRPITGLARKSLFDILAGRFEDAAVADLYCGTGTLGLEALSRGASACFFADADPAVIRRLRKNIQTLGAEKQCIIRKGEMFSRLKGWLPRLNMDLDIVFVDPPYQAVRQWSWDRAEEAVFRPLASRLVRAGVLVLRWPTDAPPPRRLGPLEVIRTRRYGQMGVAIFSHTAESTD